jgi:ketosteroid isomerase-like protein
VPTDQLQTLCDEHAVTRALTLFARAMDEHDWATLSSLLAADAEGEFGTGRLHGSAAIIEMIKGFLDSCGPTQHLLGNIIVDVAGDTAVSKAYVRDIHLNSRADPSTRLYTIGDYHDTWRRGADGSWRLTERIKHNRGYVGTLDVFEN